MKISFWEQQTYFSNIDIVIIGSGIVGLSTALELKRRDKTLKILILERGMLPMGASTKNAGFACFGSVSELLEDLENHTEDEVFSLVEKRWKGLARLRKNLGDKAIDYLNYGGYEVFDSRTEYNKCEDKIPYLNKHLSGIIGTKNIFRNADKDIVTFGFKKVKNMISNTCESQVDTGKMMTALIAKVRKLGVEIINGLQVKEIIDSGKIVSILSVDNFEFYTKKVIVTTNGFAKQLLPKEQVFPARAQVLITQPIKNLKLKGTFHYQSGYYYFRNIGNRVLLGGGRNLNFKTEETTELGLTELVQQKLDELLKTMIIPYTDYSIDLRWSGIMGVGPKKKTIVKDISKNVFCAVRLGGMGVAIGSLIAEEVAKLTLEQS
jgi:hypothetical protein